MEPLPKQEYKRVKIIPSIVNEMEVSFVLLLFSCHAKIILKN